MIVKKTKIIQKNFGELKERRNFAVVKTNPKRQRAADNNGSWLKSLNCLVV